MLSQHFSLQEFTRSLAHPNIPNVPNALQIRNMEDLCDNVLEPLRQHFGKPVTILSGFRSPDLNKAVGGVSTSQHCKGEAADIEIYGVANSELWQYIVDNLDFDQCIAERLSEDDGSAGWVHVSYTANKRRREDLSSPVAGVYKKGLVFA